VQVIERSAIVGYTHGQMFELVNDVACYPEFLPWCTHARVETVDSNQIIATLNIVRGILRTEFTTRNVAVGNSRLAMRLEKGPFKHLIGEWRFDPIGSQGAEQGGVVGSRVSLRVEFEFGNSWTGAALSGIFESLCGTLVDAFVARARALYR
jgi:ribosome-associated toxin RatA of RatAB toxin-antitoxin module